MYGTVHPIEHSTYRGARDSRPCLVGADVLSTAMVISKQRYGRRREMLDAPKKKLLWLTQRLAHTEGKADGNVMGLGDDKDGI